MTILNVSMTWGDMLVASVIGMVIVFVALTLLVFAFSLTGKLSVSNSKKRMKKQGIAKHEVASLDVSATEIAAISMALHLYFDDEHDKESNIITIKRIERRYSPWNSKIYGLNNSVVR